jgi:hypothetical protein
MKRILAASAALLIFGLLCWDASVRVGDAYPSVRRCQSDPARFAGKEIWIIPGKIINPDPEGFTLIHSTGEVRVRSNLDPPAEEYAFIRGVFKEDGTVLATGVHVESGFLAKRLGIVLISLVTLLFVSLLFVRTFEWRSGAFHARELRG